MSAFSLIIDSNGIATLTFDLPNEKINKLSRNILLELEKILDELVQKSSIKALLIKSAKEDVFIAGADLKEFKEIFQNPELAKDVLQLGHRVFGKLSKLPFPSIAVIDGVCLGGGMELALACTYRVVSDNPKTSLGLPEVSLGIFPGWGGTQRLPRLIGLKEAMSMIISGKPVNALKAWKIKLADAIFAEEFLDSKVPEFTEECLTEEGKEKILQRRKDRPLSDKLLENNPIGRFTLFQLTKKEIMEKTKGQYPAPLIALKVFEETSTLPLNEGLEKETQIFLAYGTELVPISQNLIQLFFTQEALKKDPGVSDGAKPLSIKAAGVLGAGTMGGGISWLFSYHDYPVRFKDIDWQILGKGYGTAFSIYQKLVKRKKLRPGEANLKFHKLSGTVDYSGFQNLDIVVEAAVESLEAKQKIFKELELHVNSTALISSNTSSLSITEMAKALQNPERFIGMHFFNPVDKMPLVEIVPGEKTSSQTIATAVEICKKLNKTPLVVKDSPGFLVNRIFVTGMLEMMWMLQEGVEDSKLEKMTNDFGMPMPPLILADEVGNDISYKVGKTFEEAFGERMQVPKIMELMNTHKLYGKKIGKGFYIYQGKNRKPNPEVKELLDSFSKKNENLSEEEIRDRVFFRMINEAARCLQENVVQNPAYLDMALIMGTGFPPFRGGLLKYADARGIDTVVEGLKRFEQTYGVRFKPSEKLLEMQNTRTSFY